MENFDKINTTGSVSRWYKIALGAWVPLSLVGGGAVAFYMIDQPPTMTGIIGAGANAIQVILLGLLLNYGLQYYTAKQLTKRFLLAFLVIIIIPIILSVVSREGEMPLGVLAFVALLAVSVPQLIYIGLYSLARKIFRSSPSLALVVSALVHTGLSFLLLQFLFNS